MNNEQETGTKLNLILTVFSLKKQIKGQSYKKIVIHDYLQLDIGMKFYIIVFKKA